MLCLYRGTSNWMFTVIKYFSAIWYNLNWFCKSVKRSKHYYYIILHISNRDRRGRDRIVVGFITTYAIGAYHQYRCEFEPRCSWRGVLDTTLCDKVCQCLAADWRFSLSTPLSSINKTDRRDITAILLKVALNTINLNLDHISNMKIMFHSNKKNFIYYSMASCY